MTDFNGQELLAFQVDAAAGDLLHGNQVRRDLPWEEAAAVVADRWTVLIIGELLAEPRRFNDLAQRLGIARDILTGRLRRLEANGLVAREPYQSRPMRHRYYLTAVGRELGVLLGEITSWCSLRLAGAPRPTAARDSARHAKPSPPIHPFGEEQQ